MKTISKKTTGAKKKNALPVVEPASRTDSELRSEYRFDYSKAQPNRFAARRTDRMIVLLDPDVASVFNSPAAVNTALRAIMSAIPGRSSGNKGRDRL